MILFHVPGIDSGDLRVWRRAILPACLLRRGGVAARIAVGDPTESELSGASVIVLAGAITADSGRLGQRAHAAGLRVVLDIADTRSLLTDMRAVRLAAQAADLIVAGNDELAALAADLIEPRRPLRVIGDAAAADIGASRAMTMFPAIGARAIADAIRIRAIDAARRFRHWMRGRLRAPQTRGLRIVWFGDGVELNQEGGLGELLLAAGDLVDLAQDVPFSLRVVGSSRWLFRRTIGRLPIETEFRRLTMATLARDLRGADLCFLPGGGDPASKARSAARVAIARGLGIPVLTAPHGDVAARPGLTLASDWAAALRSVVAGRRAHDDGSIESGAGATVDAWRSVVADGQGAPADKPAPHRDDRAERLRVIFLLQQFQDLDLICPVAEAASLQADMEVSVAILTKIAVPATRRLRALRDRGAKLMFWRGRDLADGKVRIAPGDFDAAVTASDGAGPGARHAATFVRAANAAGTITLNLQHGLDNTGLTFGPPPAAGATRFNAHFVLTWGGFERLTEAADPATRAKVVPVGCPKQRLRREDAADFPLAGRRFVAVFENLHWWRYSSEYRHRFVHDLVEAAIAAPEVMFLLKPHMGGQWFIRAHGKRPLPDNLVVADPGAPQWRRFAADSFLAHAAGVITTPSTIALDAARYELPTALVGYGIPAQNYVPLFRIEQAADWNAFVQQVLTGGHDMAKVRSFRDAATVPGDAVLRILDTIRMAARGRSQAEILAAMAAEARAATA